MAKARGNKSIIVAIALAVLLAVGFFAGTAFAKQINAPKGATIKLGYPAGLTGPIPHTEHSAFTGLMDYFKYINEIEGGIRGIPVKILWGDDRYQVSIAVSLYKRWVREGIIGMFSISSGNNEALKHMLAKDKVVCLSPSTSPGAVMPPGWVYFTCYHYGEEFAGVCKWIHENWKGEKPPVMGIFTWDNPAGRGYAGGGAVEFVEKNYNIKVLKPQYIPFAPVDITSQITYLKKNNADFIYGVMTAETVAPTVKHAYAAGLLPKARYIGYKWLLIEDVIKVAGKKATEGMMHQSPIIHMSEPGPGRERLKKQMQALYGKTWEANMGYSLGFSLGKIMSEAVGAALDKHGWPITGVELKEAMDNMKHLDMEGMSPPVSFTDQDPDDREGVTQMKMRQIKDGKYVDVSDWYDVPILKYNQK